MASPTSPSTSSRPETFTYPFATSPDIIRSNQKDAFFTSTLTSHLSTILRRLYGQRFTQTHTSELSAFSELLYLGLTTFIGNRTLGEEYCDVIQVQGEDGRAPAVGRRSGYILGCVVLPYLLTKALPAFRAKARLKLEARLRRGHERGEGTMPVEKYVLENLGMITSPSPVYALTLAVFYFTGSYYHLSKRVFGLRYIFTKKLAEGEQRVGYEVLGVLLVMQMAVQGWLHIRDIVGNMKVESAAKDKHRLADMEGETEQRTSGDNIFETGEPAEISNLKSRIESTAHTPELEDGPRYDLKDRTMMAWVQGKQLRNCTLCLEAMKDPSAMTCGHVFCWTCIQGWLKEKPECPLCRQTVLGQHVLPLRG
ncbi:MAG: hypothetical protein L6R40_007492 [Gallowayella cf. fulva]|nr:MAG: hypothetical protein L6R40_007492 [Xanthomendoza cf. fulva]